MGMFDDVTEVPQQKCQGCGTDLAGWQSKDGPCQLEQIPFWRVSEFYTSCHKCGMWHQFDLRVEPTPRPLSDYVLSIRAKDAPWEDLRSAEPQTPSHEDQQ